VSSPRSTQVSSTIEPTIEGCQSWYSALHTTSAQLAVKPTVSIEVVNALTHRSIGSNQSLNLLLALGLRNREANSITLLDASDVRERVVVTTVIATTTHIVTASAATIRLVATVTTP
jgi:hypothetical protein